MNACFALLVAAAGFAGVLAAASPAVAASSAVGGSGRATVRDGLLIINTGDYVVRFRESSAWTIHSADYQDNPLLTPTGAYQSVLRIKQPAGQPAAWIGTGHGGEIVESITLQVDGTEHPVSADLAVAGTTFTLVKISQLGPYAHEARITVAPDGIAEDLRYEMVGEPIDIQLMYAFMHCFNNQTQQWIVGLEGDQEERGEFTDDNSFTLRRDIRWAAVYAPSMKAGMVYAYPEIYIGGGSLKNTFWNRPRDNKLYLTVHPSQEPGAVFGYSVRLRGFTATDAEWEQEARKTLEPLLAEPAR